MGKRSGSGDYFIRADYEWLASLLSAGFNGLEQLVLHEVIVQCLGWARRASATLSPTDIGERIGQEPTNVSRAIRGLCKQGVLVKLDDGTYRPVFDYTRWDLGEKPAKRQARLELCRGAEKHAQSFGPPPDATPRPRRRDPQLQLPFREPPADDPPGPSPPPDMTATASKDDQKRSSEMIKFDQEHDQKRSSPLIKFDHLPDVPPTPPIGERARKSEFKSEVDVFFEKGPEGQSGPDSKKKDSSLSGKPTPAERAARFAALKLHREVHHEG